MTHDSNDNSSNDGEYIRYRLGSSKRVRRITKPGVRGTGADSAEWHDGLDSLRGLVDLSEHVANQLAEASDDMQRCMDDFQDAINDASMNFIRQRIMTDEMSDSLITDVPDKYNLARDQRTLVLFAVCARLIHGFSGMLVAEGVRLQSHNSGDHSVIMEINKQSDFNLFHGYLAAEYAQRIEDRDGDTSDAERDTRNMLELLGISEELIAAFMTQVRENGKKLRNGDISKDEYERRRVSVCDEFASSMAKDMMAASRARNNSEGDESDGTQQPT